MALKAVSSFPFVYVVLCNLNMWLSLVYSAGVIVKNIVKGSTVDQDGRIHIGDTILSVSFSKKNNSIFFFFLHYEEKYLVVSEMYSLLNLNDFNIPKSAQIATFCSFIHTN